ncbi:MAG: nitrate ABC transporter ATP-binding protein [Oscillatoria princeps RMCB-10]|jgi:nitrate ABC transporter ATP-binding subunit|nr:nitrate ABC transporter ATP-binding protein [Oscillatoria princeps RMCB-10]
MQSLTSASLTQNSKLEAENSRREPFLEIESVSKVYSTPTGPYTVLNDVSLNVAEGEFICIIGHSGCGKSTLLNMVAGFSTPTGGEVRLQNRRITKPGPDRMMVFQNYCLLPWKTAFENVYLAVKSAYPEKSHAEKVAIVEEHLAMVGLTEAANKRPGQLSGGMKQRVAIARALAIRPQVLILDEPFGALDAITKEELQEELLQIWSEHRVTVLMITHDIDEALFLADRLVMMTNGPSAKIGEVLEIPFKRPRVRSQVMEDPRYRELRNYALDFLFHRFAHSEDPSSAADAAPSPRSRGLALKAGAALALTAVAAAAGIGLSRSVKIASQTPAQTAVIQSSATGAPVSESTGTSSDSTATVSESTGKLSDSSATAAPAITDPAAIEELKWKLFDEIDRSWRTVPTFAEDLVYRVKVSADGAIAGYEPVSPAAKDYVGETPLPVLSERAGKNVGDPVGQPVAQFKVVFAPTGVLEVNP